MPRVRIRGPTPENKIQNTFDDVSHFPWHCSSISIVFRKPIEELIEPYLNFLPAQVRSNWDRFHDIAFPILRENSTICPRVREFRTRTRSRTLHKRKPKKFIILSRAVARNEKQVVKNFQLNYVDKVNDLIFQFCRIIAFLGTSLPLLFSNLMFPLI